MTGMRLLIILVLNMMTFEAIANEAMAEIRLGEFRFAAMADLAEQSCHAKSLDVSHWQEFEFPHIKPQQHLCIRGAIDVSAGQLPASPALFFAALAAWEIYLNGELIGSNGVPGASTESEGVGGISSVLPLDSAVLKPGKHFISVEISSFRAASSFASVAWALLIIDQAAFFDTILYVSIITALLIGGLSVMFVIFITLYLGFSRQNSYLLFALLCLCTATLLLAEQWKLWVNYAYDLHLYRMYIVISITLVVIMLLPGYYLTQHALQHKRLWLTGLGFGAVLVVIVIPSYDARSEWLFIMALSFVLLINLTACRHKKAGAKTASCIAGFSLLAIVFAPRFFIELGFGLSIALVLISICLSLLKQLIRQRDLALETGKVKGELLRRNLQPHYLMNCLMQVQELIDVAPAEASEFVQQLAEEFRTLVKMSDKDVVSLEDELQLCRSHLKIMSVRYQQNYQLELVFDGNQEALNTSQVIVPAAIIHSQIENCFSHNRITANRSIVLKVKGDEQELLLELATPIDSATEHQGVGIGEAYIRAKMVQVCQPGWQLQSQAIDNNWVTRYQYRLLSEFAQQKQGAQHS